MEKIRVLMVEDDPVWMRGLSSFLLRQEDLEIVGQAEDARSALRIVEELECGVDVVLMDVFLGEDPEGLFVMQEILKCDNNIQVIMLTSSEEDQIVYSAFQSGASDYIIKSKFEEIPEGIRAAHQRKSPIRPAIAEKIRREFSRLKDLESEFEAHRLRTLLTPTELSVLSLVGENYTQTQIAEKLVISVRTVKVHVGNILRKMQQTSSKEAACKAREVGVI